MRGNLVAWLTLTSAVLVLVALVYEIARPTEEPRVRPLMLALATMGLGGIVGSLPKLFGLENEPVRWAFTAIQFACLVYGVRQLVRAVKHAEEEEQIP